MKKSKTAMHQLSNLLKMTKKRMTGAKFHSEKLKKKNQNCGKILEKKMRTYKLKIFGNKKGIEQYILQIETFTTSRKLESYLCFFSQH